MAEIRVLNAFINFNSLILETSFDNRRQNHEKHWQRENCFNVFDEKLRRVSRLKLSDGFFRFDSFEILSAKIVSKQARKNI